VDGEIAEVAAEVAGADSPSHFKDIKKTGLLGPVFFFQGDP
jgi:hypothetical protein